MRVTKEVADILDRTFKEAAEAHYEIVTPEQLLYVISCRSVFHEAFVRCGGSVEQLQEQLKEYLRDNIGIFINDDGEPEMSEGLEAVLAIAQACADNCDKRVVELPHLIYAFYSQDESYAVYYMESQGITKSDILQELDSVYEELERNSKKQSAGGKFEVHTGRAGQDGFLENGGRTEGESSEEPAGKAERWRKFVICLNEESEQGNPLIGREAELERTMQILCRKEKNNPLHIGEPGVGKTAIVYGLARLIEEGKVPEPLKGAKIFSFDLGSLLAGTQYRGDFEKRFREVMEGIEGQKNPIVYIDEIHNIVGAGAVGNGSFDVSNMLKPYLASGQVRFIGATTYEEYKKHFEKSKSLVRRFQNVDIEEPGEKDAVKILQGLKKHYEKFHGVKYGKGVLEYAVQMSSRYINERYLPDKAIDLIDEAGAYRKIHPLDQKTQSVGKDLIDEILAKTCHIPKQVVEHDEVKQLETLERRLSSRVFSQNEAVGQVVNAVKFSRAGLLEAGKPLASLLFVGPTGVGKTEIARSLADELGIKLIRFDMSEYEEKHAVAKLIGAPAGYVGYEEGGLLTEEIRKNPHAVLLLDEIEKAHSDIYNILLQVMDYATLTDNQGRKADFRNVLLIMTSNAGANQVGKAQIGFGDRSIRSDVIMEEVKKTFQPEFRNRLSRIVVFNGMDDQMAEAVVGKKLRELGGLLEAKKVEFSFSQQAAELLKKKGISQEYGAREIERVIGSEIKPLLVDEILFGRLKRGGSCALHSNEDKFTIRIERNRR